MYNIVVIGGGIIGLATARAIHHFFTGGELDAETSLDNKLLNMQ